MKETIKAVLILIIGFSFMMTSGCEKQVRKTDFLSDYSRLEPVNGSLRYLDIKRLGNYTRFIIEPVDVRLAGIPQGSRPDRETRRELADYMHNALINAIKDRYVIVSRPGPGVARVRVAITNMEKGTPAWNVLPQTKLTGLGLGGASMEGELLDSQTGDQIGALVEGQKGKMVSLSGLKDWGDAKAVMDDWAKRFRKRLDEVHETVSRTTNTE